MRRFCQRLEISWSEHLSCNSQSICRWQFHIHSSWSASSRERCRCIEKFTFRLRLCSLVFTVQRSLVRDHGLAAIFPYRQSSTEDYSFLPGEQAGVTSNIVYCTVIEKLIPCDSVGSRQSENNADNVTTRLIWQDFMPFTAVSYAVAL